MCILSRCSDYRSIRSCKDSQPNPCYCSIVLIVLTIARSKVKNDNVYRFAAYVTLAISVLTLLSTKVSALEFVTKLPLGNLGFNWVIPAIVAGVIGSFVGKKNIA